MIYKLFKYFFTPLQPKFVISWYFLPQYVLIKLNKLWTIHLDEHGNLPVKNSIINRKS